VLLVGFRGVGVPAARRTLNLMTSSNDRPCLFRMNLRPAALIIWLSRPGWCCDTADQESKNGQNPVLKRLKPCRFHPGGGEAPGSLSDRSHKSNASRAEMSSKQQWAVTHIASSSRPRYYLPLPTLPSFPTQLKCDKGDSRGVGRKGVTLARCI